MCLPLQNSDVSNRHCIRATGFGSFPEKGGKICQRVYMYKILVYLNLMFKLKILQYSTKRSPVVPKALMALENPLRLNNDTKPPQNKRRL